MSEASEAIRQLLEMFPKATISITFTDSPQKRSVSIKVDWRITTHSTLEDCMAIARKWKNGHQLT